MYADKLAMGETGAEERIQVLPEAAVVAAREVIHGGRHCFRRHREVMTLTVERGPDDHSAGSIAAAPPGFCEAAQQCALERQQGRILEPVAGVARRAMNRIKRALECCKTVLHRPPELFETAVA